MYDHVGGTKQCLIDDVCEVAHNECLVFLEIFFYQLFDKDSVLNKCGFIDFYLQNVLMEKEVIEEVDGFGNEGLALLVAVDGDGEDFPLY